MADTSTEQQILGTLMYNPKLLLQSDKYQIKTEDFNSNIMKYIFWAIENLAPSATGPLTPYEVEQWLSNSPTGKALFDSKNGRQFLVDCYNTPVSSFDGLYMQFQRENLINDLGKFGYNTDKIYVQHPISIEEKKIAEKYANSTPQDIISNVENDFMKIKSKYTLKDTSEVQSLFTGIEEMMNNLSEFPEIGLPLQGKLFNYIVSGALSGTFYLRSGSSGLGKALPNSTKIPTPNGWKKVKEIVVGDYLFDAFGKPTKVLGVFPQGKKEVYEVVFKDGRSARCCKEHLWSFNTGNQKKQSRDNRVFYTETLEEIMQRGLKNSRGNNNILIPMQYAVEYSKKKLPIPPYSFGLMLGDGSFRQQNSNKSFQYSSEDDYLPSKIAEENNWYLKKSSINNFTWYFSYGKDRKNIFVEEVLKDFPELINTYSNTKFIPRVYIESSIEQRFELLNGLLDSDGHVDEKGRVSYYTNSPMLRDNVEEIAKSLGFKTHIIEDTHKETSVLYIISITGRPEDKIKLFKIPRKHDTIVNWYNNRKRKESNSYNPMIEIKNLGYKEEMTCFMVDNKEHLFLTEDFIVTHNTRSIMADACYLSFPVRYNWKIRKWEQVGFNEKVLVVITEQDFDEVQKMAVAYMTGINESVFKHGQCDEEQKKVIKEALEIFKEFKDNFLVVRVPSPNITLIKQLIREQVKLHNIKYVFYDYIFISPSLLSEFKGMALRNDEILLMFSDALKQLAVELDIFIMSSTQVNSKADESSNIRNEASLAGSRAVINKADMGCIMARPTTEELSTLKPIIEQLQKEPNVVTDIYKVRGGEYNQVRIWSIMDLGTLRKEDLFVTDSKLEVFSIPYQSFDYDVEMDDKVWNILNRLNNTGRRE